MLRYWEQEFPQLRPKKGKSGNRLYQEKDLRTVERIKNLLYEKRFTIAGARSQLSLLTEEIEAPVDERNERNGILPDVLEEVKQELREILKLMK